MFPTFYYKMQRTVTSKLLGEVCCAYVENMHIILRRYILPRDLGLKLLLLTGRYECSFGKDMYWGILTWSDQVAGVHLEIHSLFHPK